MALLSLSDLLTSLSWEQIRDSSYTVLSALGFNVTSWRSGGVARTIVALLSRTLAPWTSLIADVTASGFLDYASGAGLRITAKQVYNVEAEPASFATGFVTLNNSGGGVYSHGPDEITFQDSTTNKTFRNSEAFTLGALETGKVVALKAVEVGAASTAVPGAINTLVTTLLGVTCSNASALVGTDAESDDSIKAKCRAKWLALSPDGPAAAYDYVARSAALNGGVHVTRAQVLGDSDHGIVTVYIADEDGAISGGDVAKVQTGIERWAEPICTEATVASATAVPVDLTITAYATARSGLDEPTALARVTDGLTSYIGATPVGGVVVPPKPGTLYRLSLIEALGRILPEAFLIEMAVPSDDVDLGDGLVAVIGSVSFSLTLVSA